MVPTMKSQSVDSARTPSGRKGAVSSLGIPPDWNITSTRADPYNSIQQLPSWHQSPTAVGSVPSFSSHQFGATAIPTFDSAAAAASSMSANSHSNLVTGTLIFPSHFSDPPATQSDIQDNPSHLFKHPRRSNTSHISAQEIAARFHNGSGRRSNPASAHDSISHTPAGSDSPMHRTHAAAAATASLLPCSRSRSRNTSPSIRADGAFHFPPYPTHSNTIDHAVRISSSRTQWMKALLALIMILALGGAAFYMGRYRIGGEEFTSLLQSSSLHIPVNTNKQQQARIDNAIPTAADRLISAKQHEQQMQQQSAVNLLRKPSTATISSVPPVSDPYLKDRSVETRHSIPIPTNMPTVAPAPFSPASSDDFRIVVRILSSGWRFHRELDRLINSLKQASYIHPSDGTVELGTQPLSTMRVDVEISVDLPRELMLPHIPSRVSGATDGEISIATAKLHKLITSQSYQDAKFEHDLTLLRARAFANDAASWPWGSISVRTIEPAEAREQAGLFNLFFAWDPATLAPISVTRQASVSPFLSHNTWLLHLSDTHVLSPWWARAVYLMSRSHWGGVSGGSNPVSGKGVLDSTALFGIILEPPEITFGATKGKTGKEEKFDASLRGESQVEAALKSIQTSSSINPTLAPALFYAQSLSPSRSGVLGGLLISSLMFMQLRGWAESPPLALIGPAPSGAKIQMADGNRNHPNAPTLSVYTPLLSGQPIGANPVCVPGLASNVWVNANTTTSLSDDIDLHRQRVYGRWFLLGLLHRYMYEHGLYALHWYPPPGSGLALLSSSTFQLPRNLLMQHEHAHPIGSKAEAQHAATVALDAEEAQAQRDALPLPKLKRELLPPESTIWQGGRLSPIPFVFDFAFNAHDVPVDGLPQPPNPLLSSEKICPASLKSGAQPVKDAPSLPFEESMPPPEELAKMENLVAARRDEVAAKVRERVKLNQTPTPVRMEDIENVLDEEELQLLSPFPPSVPSGVAVDPLPRVIVGGVNLTSLPSEELVRTALATAKAHSIHIPICVYESGSVANQDADGFPLLDFSKGPFLTDPSLLYSNTSNDFKTCFDAYENDLHLAIHRVNPSASITANIRHERIKQEYLSLMRLIREEYQKKELIEQLTRQLELIENEAQDKRDAELLKKYQNRLKKDSDFKNKLSKAGQLMINVQKANETLAGLSKKQILVLKESIKLSSANKLHDADELKSAKTKEEKKSIEQSIKQRDSAEQLKLDEIDESKEMAEKVLSDVLSKAEKEKIILIENLEKKRLTGKGEIDSVDEYQQFLSILEQKKIKRKRIPLKFGRRRRR
jgi:hypothetical protein